MKQIEGFFLLMIVLTGVPAAGQTALERFDRQVQEIQRARTEQWDAAVPADRRALIDYGGYFTFNYLSVDDALQNNHGLRQYDLVGYTRVVFDPKQEIYFRGRITWRNFNPGDSFDGEGNHSHATVDLAYYKLNLAGGAGTTPNTGTRSAVTTFDQGVLIAGRQLAYWANGLTLSRTLDGLSLDASLGLVSARLLAGLTAYDSGDFDSSRPNFDDHTLRGFYGGMLTLNLQSLQPFVYGVVQSDYNHGDRLITPLRPAPIVTRFGYNSFYIGAGATGTIGDHLSVGLEAVYEGGTGLSNSFVTTGGIPAPVKQSNEPISAAAADLRLDYLLNDLNRTRFGGEIIFGTGDSDRLNSSATLGGNRRGTTDNAFNGFGLVNTGLAFGGSVSNLLAIRLSASTFPLTQWPAFRQLQLGADGFVLLKADRDAPIDEPTQHGRLLGFEPDLFLNWQIRSDITLAVRYGAFLPDRRVFADSRARQFLYCGVTFAF